MKTMLALDLGTKTGYALRKSDGRIEYGSINTAPKRKQGRGVRWQNFKRFLLDTKQANPDISAIVYEDVRRHAGTDAAHCYGGFRAVLEMFCEHHGIEYSGVGVGTWKKAFTGNGAASKDVVKDRCQQLGFVTKASDESDALGILFFSINQNEERG